jgi:hypothetical protein
MTTNESANTATGAVDIRDILESCLTQEQIAEWAKQMTSGGKLSAAGNAAQIGEKIGEALILNQVYRGPGVRAVDLLDDQADGPVSPNGFRYRGRKCDGMPPKPWLLLNHLWQCPSRECDYMDLAEPVWGDDATGVEPGGNLGSARREANRFFDKKGLPFRIEVDTRQKVARLIESPA